MIGALAIAYPTFFYSTVKIMLSRPYPKKFGT